LDVRALAKVWKMLDDLRLVAQLNGGNKDALRAIYQRYRQDLFTVAVSLVADPHLAEDCLQDVFVHLAESAGTLSIRTNLRAYLASAIVNRARDCLRRDRRQVDCPVDDLQLAANQRGPDNELLRSEQARLLSEAMGRLPLEQREVFVLRVQAKVTFLQISRLQEVPLRTVHSRYRYAIEKLRQLLTEGDGR
jgi:RNA polymerase sigma-70 factor, ECF subfamily